MESCACLDDVAHELSLEESRRWGVAHPGLPGPLPRGEHVLWQGAPRWQAFARDVFHTDLILLYFAVLAVWRAVDVVQMGGGVGQTAVALIPIVVSAGLVIGLLAVLGWLGARAAIYTLTNRRIVLRIGAAWSKTVDIPFKAIETVELKAGRSGLGALSIKVKGDKTIPYAILWPHVRPWRLRSPEPMLRALPDVAGLARTLVSLLQAERAGEGTRAPATTCAAATPRPPEIPDAPPSPAAVAARAAARSARLPLLGAAGLVVLSLLAVTLAQLGATDAQREAMRSPARVHDLIFHELGPERLAVIDANRGETVTMVEPGRDGLVLRAFRGLERARGLRGLPAGAPYQLVIWDTGRVTLSDLASDRHIPIDSFGPASGGALADLMKLERDSRQEALQTARQ